jgi:hypothetical protein
MGCAARGSNGCGEWRGPQQSQACSFSKVAAPRQQASEQQRTRLVSASALEPIVLETSERLPATSIPARYEGVQALLVWRWR